MFSLLKWLKLLKHELLGWLTQICQSFPCPFGSCGEQNQVTIPDRAKMWTRNEPTLLSLWFLSTVGLCMILLPCLKVCSIGGTYIFSHAILQNMWELSIKQPLPWRFLELYREMLWLLRDHFLNTATNTRRRLHTAEHSKRFPSKYWQHNCDGCHSSHKKLF